MSLRLERLAMDAAIRGGSYPNVSVFMRRFEVSERTVHGDLAFMRERMNAPRALTRRCLGISFETPLRSVITKRSLSLPAKLQHDLDQFMLDFTFHEPR